MNPCLLTLAQSSNGGGSAVGGAAAAGVGLVLVVCYIAVIAFFIATMWKVFTKAGQPGWGCIVPILNVYFMCKIAGRPGWWVLLMFIPLVNIIVGIILTVDMAKSFGKGIGFALGMIFLGFIFYPILAWGSAQYQGPAAG